jgi:hypothetical protein
MTVKPGLVKLREGQRLRKCEGKFSRRIFGPKRDEVRGGAGENCIMKGSITCIL